MAFQVRISRRLFMPTSKDDNFRALFTEPREVLCIVYGSYPVFYCSVCSEKLICLEVLCACSSSVNEARVTLSPQHRAGRSALLVLTHYCKVQGLCLQFNLCCPATCRNLGSHDSYVNGYKAAG